ncbi:MAG: T9SS type A sorting domain-containing protein [Cytophagaceae bacterium]|nr:MAG: T9SS type A sorting domain-containing protein [Cytophagaceae bacterium]
MHGPNPQLPANAGVNDNVAMQFDFRSIYTSILQDWFQVSPATLTTLFGRSFPYVPVIRPSALATASASQVAGFSVYPNPSADDQPTLSFTSEGGPVQVAVFDGIGREVRRPVDGRTLGVGAQLVPLDLRGLAPGAYHCTVREGSRRSSQVVVVQ